jgi:hypothetical protein
MPYWATRTGNQKAAGRGGRCCPVCERGRSGLIRGSIGIPQGQTRGGQATVVVAYASVAGGVGIAASGGRCRAPAADHEPLNFCISQKVSMAIV